MIIDYLISKYAFNEETLRNYVLSAPHRYKVFDIPKSNGKGYRTIAQPTKLLKHLQKIVLKEYLEDLPVHQCAMAYKKDTSIKKNAEAHRSGSFFLKMDFKDFFPSIVPDDLIAHVKQHSSNSFSEDDYEVVKDLFFYKQRKPFRRLCLSVGAPSSPFISNSLLYAFDQDLFEFCKERNVTYSRYADDLTFSTNEHGVLFDFPKEVRKILQSMNSPELRLNSDKTVFLSKKGNIHITGLTITTDGRVSVGRQNKRYIKSLVNKFVKGTLEDPELPYLKGYLSFCNDVEKTFISSLDKKFGSGVVRAIHSTESRDA